MRLYPYIAPVILTPLSFLLWRSEYHGNVRMAIAALLIPVLWVYIVSGIGTNVLKVWEFDTRLRLGRFRPHHGFVFGSATAMLAWLAHAGPAHDLWDVTRSALVMGSVIGFWNLLYDIKALQSGILRIYNQPWADGKGAAEIVLDYAPWFFGGFGAIYGAGLALMEWLPNAYVAVVSITLALALVVPVAAYVCQSIVRHGHWGTRPCPVMDVTPSVSEGPGGAGGAQIPFQRAAPPPRPLARARGDRGM
jgi:hypothetical protein